MIKIRYAQIRKMDISNGEGIGISLFVQGCPFHCKNCFNQSTWDFDGGMEWTEDTKKNFLKLASSPQVKRISILGGEALAKDNLESVLDLVNKIKLSYPQKTIWLYSGFYWEEIFNGEEDRREEIVSKCDVLVDGRYIDELRDTSLKWKGSSNQRCISVHESIKQDKIILYCD